jgi:cellulose synthase (UDP-forming)
MTSQRSALWALGPWRPWGWAWGLLALTWVALAWISVPTATQAALAWGVLVLLACLQPWARCDPLARLTVLCLAAWLTVRYLIWRATETLGYQDLLSWIAALLLFAAECYSIVSFLLVVFVVVHPKVRQPVPLPANSADWPAVDVLVPTYNESPELLETTLLGALNMRYAPGKVCVYLLDDGGTRQRCQDPDPVRAEAARQRAQTLQELCRRLGVQYLTREDNSRAKAGNINAALPRIQGELVAIFDADHVPTIDFLECTVGAFCSDPKLFLVQTPHFFVNPDPLEHNWRVFGRMPGENDLFYHVIQRGLDSWNASFFCGSAALLRRSALLSIGGLPGQTITEDAEVSLLLHARGWNSAYLDRLMVAGLQPETYSSFVSQRVRWAQGMTQIMLIYKPLTLPGLRWWQRLAYFNAGLHWFFPWARLVFLLAPAMYLIFGLHVYQASLPQFFAYTLPYLVATILTSRVLHGHARWTFMSDLYELMQSVYVASGIWRVLRNPRSPRFLVTPKGEQREQVFISQLAKPFYVFMSIGLLALGFAVWRWIVDTDARDTVVFIAVWQTLNLMLLAGLMGVLLEQPQRRAAPRMPLESTARLWIDDDTAVDVRFEDLSSTGCKLALRSWQIGHSGKSVILEVRVDVLQRTIRLPARVAWERQQEIGLRFEPTSLAMQRDIVALAYGDSRRWLMFQRHRESQERTVMSSAWFLVRHGWSGTVGHLRHAVWAAIRYLPSRLRVVLPILHRG